MSDSYRVSKLTDCKWANLFEVDYARRKQPLRRWIMCSRNDNPVADVSRADAVVIVATIDTGAEKKLVVTKEFRVPIWDFEYGFPAGLIDDGEDVETTVAPDTICSQLYYSRIESIALSSSAVKSELVNAVTASSIWLTQLAPMSALVISLCRKTHAIAIWAIL